jgi:hypothetical protein
VIYPLPYTRRVSSQNCQISTDTANNSPTFYLNPIEYEGAPVTIYILSGTVLTETEFLAYLEGK